MLSNLKKDLYYLKNSEKSKIYSKYFKTGKGEYGEGDIFIGVTVPNQRIIAKKYKDFSLSDVSKLLKSKIHEHRLTALFILVYKFKKSDEKTKKKIYNLYLKHTKYVNNWDLVDSSAHYIVGAYLFDKDRTVLYGLAKSKNLWEKRISIISTYYFISKNDFKDTLKISEFLLHDTHDLIHKAVGWMLREIGKRNMETEEKFLLKHYKTMPRTMLRYAIEKFPEKKRKYYMAKHEIYLLY
ncbi:DNA alkylation repair protein [Candidatus Micrarchaeota archaeon]|nr:DNA alkylation repair protein [Candidatus Micrarchaeota archaeon]